MIRTSDLTISIIPGIIYSELIAQKWLCSATPGSRLAVMGIMIITYVIAGCVPYACVVVAAGNAIMYLGLSWVLFDKIDMIWIRLLLKGFSSILITAIEFGICRSIMVKPKSKIKLSNVFKANR